jgi:very-short-patch-repair endonuclease
METGAPRGASSCTRSSQRHPSPIPPSAVPPQPGQHDDHAVCAITSIHTTAALRAAGVGQAELRRALTSGLLRRVRRGVYARADACPALLAVAEHGGVPACVTAARHLGLWVLDEDPAVPHVWMPRGRHVYHARADGCRCVEHWDEGATAHGFALPSTPRILLQIAHCVGIEAFFVSLESALRLGLLTDRGRRWLQERAPRRLHEALAFARDDADSGLESLVRWRLRQHGLTVRSQVSVYGVGRVDLLIGDRLIVETDGAVNHDGLPLRHKDLVRDANAAAWGYTTLRFDYELVVHEWYLVEAAILGALAAQARGHSRT